MQLLPSALLKVIEELGKLPGVGPRTAERYAFYLLRADKTTAQGIAVALDKLHNDIRTCLRCFNLSEQELCPVCEATHRDNNLLAVVEEPLDVVALEKTGQYRGVYHVLGGAISPLEGVGPEQLQISSLLKRLDQEEINELILATNASVEGESTALYIQKLLRDRPFKITRLARGLPVGVDLEYADQITLSRALQGRQSV